MHCFTIFIHILIRAGVIVLFVKRVVSMRQKHPDEKNRKAFYDFYNTIVPMDMRINSNQALPASPTITDGSCSEEDDDA